MAYLVEWATDPTFSDGSSSIVSLLSGGAPFHKVKNIPSENDLLRTLLSRNDKPTLYRSVCDVRVTLDVKLRDSNAFYRPLSG